MKRDWRLLLSALGVVFLSEMGDKTQVTTMLLAGAKPAYIFFVALGSATALVATSLIEVMVGSRIVARFIKPSTTKLASGAAFVVMGILLLLGILGAGGL